MDKNLKQAFTILKKLSKWCMQTAETVSARKDDNLSEGFKLISVRIDEAIKAMEKIGKS